MPTKRSKTVSLSEELIKRIEGLCREKRQETGEAVAFSALVESLLWQSIKAGGAAK